MTADPLATPSQLRPVACTRVSTLATSLDDKEGLFGYIAATTLQSVAAHPDLRTRLALTDHTGSWKEFSNLYAEARARRGNVEASEGTNIHATVEALVWGRDVGGVDAGTVRAAQAVLRELSGIGLFPAATEEFVYVPGLPEPAAGTRDILARVGDTDLHVVVDIKSTSELRSDSLRMKGLAWGIQLAAYSRGLPYVASFARDSYGRPKLDPGLACVEERDVDQAHGWVVEVERRSGLATSHRLDLAAGWRNAELACAVRAARKSAH
jgi:hypothetical protein